MAGPLTQIENLVGTGPFKIAERRPDQYVRLTRFDGYVPSPLPPSGYAGARNPGSNGLTFVPVPNVNTRLQGLLSGEYDIADGLSTDNYAQLEKSPSLTPSSPSPAAGCCS